MRVSCRLRLRIGPFLGQRYRFVIDRLGRRRLRLGGLQRWCRCGSRGGRLLGQRHVDLGIGRRGGRLGRGRRRRWRWLRRDRHCRAPTFCIVNQPRRALLACLLRQPSIPADEHALRVEPQRLADVGKCAAGVALQLIDDAALGVGDGVARLQTKELPVIGEGSIELAAQRVR